ncbi:hypothetical protein [Halobacteriovorax sp. HLS]|uniref:hypothetical protein n=1 Tax=Halobacteriovorax sp. HLS TaxID=2234000 RepID=UPI000FDA3EAB|nr:hypothetical protein [Halobacteriovorax sp. HLS]
MIRTLILILFLNLSSWSADLYLYDDTGSFNDEFSKNILTKDLKDGERIFLKDRSVIYKGVLGSGNTTLILKVIDPESNTELALRLPHGNEEKNFLISDGKRFINYTYSGFNELQEMKLPIPKIHEFQKDSYLLVDLIEHDFTLRTFFARNEHIDEVLKTKVVNALAEFSKKSAIYETIGDFHLEQLVYSIEKDKWFLLDWVSGHQLARLPSSPNIFKYHHIDDNRFQLDENGKTIYTLNTAGNSKKVEREISEFERDTLNFIKEQIEEQRVKQVAIDEARLESLKLELSKLTNKEDILEVYKNNSSNHLASFYTLLQKDFINNHLSKFPQGKLTSEELDSLLTNLGKFSPYYFSQFTEKILSSINDLNAFMILYDKINEIGLDEELEDDVAIAISKNIERILSNTTNDPSALKTIEELKGSFGVINYRTRDLLSNAQEYLLPKNSCNNIISSFF